MKMFRIIAGKKQTEIAEMLCVERATVSKWENGKNEPELNMLIKLSDYYKTTLDELVTGDLQQAHSELIKDSVIKSAERINSAMKTEAVTKTEDDELFMFPRISPNASTGLNLFVEACKIDFNDNGTNADEYVKMCHLYMDAFNSGVMDAGINLLRVFSKYHLVLKANGDNNPYAFQRKMEYIIATLKSIEHPAGEYYEALSLIYNLMDMGGDEQTAFDRGLVMMYDLANEGNEYATEWADIIDAAETE